MQCITIIAVQVRVCNKGSNVIVFTYVCCSAIWKHIACVTSEHIFQDFLHANVADLLNHHVLLDSANITGQVLIELGRAETYVLRCARQQTGGFCLPIGAVICSLVYMLFL